MSESKFKMCSHCNSSVTEDIDQRYQLLIELLEEQIFDVRYILFFCTKILFDIYFCRKMHRTLRLSFVNN